MGYTRFFGGQFLLQGAGGTVRIPAGIRGAEELIERIGGKIGREACAEAQKALDEKRTEMEKVDAVRRPGKEELGSDV